MNSSNLFGENNESQSNNYQSVTSVQNNNLNNQNVTSFNNNQINQNSNSSVGLERPQSSSPLWQNTPVSEENYQTPFTKMLNEDQYQTPFTVAQDSPFTKDAVTTQKMTTSPSALNYMIDNQNNEKLLEEFIGNKYEKIINKPFNIFGFLFGTFYIFYRKMYLFGIIIFILDLIIFNFIKNIIISLILVLVLRIIIGFSINKICVLHSKKKIIKIKIKGTHSNFEELKNICSKKGGASVGSIFLGIFAELGIALAIVIVMLLFGVKNYITSLFDFKDSNEEDDNTQVKETLVEDVMVNGYSCINTKCNITIEDANGDTIDYTLKSGDAELFKILDSYNDYININIYYIISNNERRITKYNIFLKSNDEDISNVKTEEELRKKIGLYTLGNHTDTLTLTKIGKQGSGISGNETYTYITYTFTVSNEIEYKMKYINPNKNLKLTEGKKYTVTFEVVEGTFDYEYKIKSIK